MGEARHCNGRPFSKFSEVPSGSRLAAFLKELDLEDFDTPEAKEQAYARWLAGLYSPAYEAGLVEDLQAAGLTLDLENPTHALVFDVYVKEARSALAHFFSWEPTRRPGNPGLNDFLCLIAFQAVLVRLDKGHAQSACWRLAAEDLGPGIRADQVKRAVSHALVHLDHAFSARKDQPEWADALTAALGRAHEITAKWGDFQAGRVVN